MNFKIGDKVKRICRANCDIFNNTSIEIGELATVTAVDEHGWICVKKGNGKTVGGNNPMCFELVARAGVSNLKKI